MGNGTSPSPVDEMGFLERSFFSQKRVKLQVSSLRLVVLLQIYNGSSGFTVKSKLLAAEKDHVPSRHFREKQQVTLPTSRFN